jgi:hypothetical protein
MVDQRRFDGVDHNTAWRGPLSPIDVQPYLETPTEDRRSIDTPAGVEKVSGEDFMAVASSLTRWGGAAAVLGGLSTTFVGGLLPPLDASNAKD